MRFLLPRKTAVRVVPKNKPDTITVLSQAQGFPCAYIEYCSDAETHRVQLCL